MQFKPKVLIVSYYFPPANTPVTQHPQWLLRYLTECGFEAHVLSSSVFFGEAVNAPLVKGNVHSLPEGERARRLANRLSQAEFLIQARIGIWDHGFAWGRAYGIGAGLRMLRSGGFSAIVSVSPSIASHWTAWRIKRRFPGVKWIADFTDPFLGNPLRPTKPWLGPIERRLERGIFSSADYLAANTKPARDLWLSRYPEIAGKFVVIPNGFDPDEPIAPRPLPPRATPILAHAGGVYGGRMPNALFDAMFELAQNGRIQPGQISIEFLGAGDFENAARPDRLRFLCQTGFVRIRNEHVPRAEALRFIEEADSLLLLDITAPHNTKLQVPSKLFDYLRVGRPILAFTGAGSPVAKLLELGGVPHVTIPNEADSAEVQAEILRFLTLPREPHPMSPWVNRYFDARNIVVGVAGLIESGQREDIPDW